MSRSDLRAPPCSVEWSYKFTGHYSIAERHSAGARGPARAAGWPTRPGSIPANDSWIRHSREITVKVTPPPGAPTP
eukprot:762781-Hanusia_phi.AAC.21